MYSRRGERHDAIRCGQEQPVHWCKKPTDRRTMHQSWRRERLFAVRWVSPLLETCSPDIGSTHIPLPPLPNTYRWCTQQNATPILSTSLHTYTEPTLIQKTPTHAFSLVRRVSMSDVTRAACVRI